MAMRVQGGAISLKSANDIFITGGLNSSSSSPFGNAGSGGAISLKSANGSITTGGLNSSAFSPFGNAGSGARLA
jgi:hypothetical protein